MTIYQIGPIDANAGLQQTVNITQPQGPYASAFSNPSLVAAAAPAAQAANTPVSGTIVLWVIGALLAIMLWKGIS
jgi:hypothetical protein